MNKKWLSYAPLSLALVVAFLLAGVDHQIHPRLAAFSDDSLKQISILNHEYGMTATDLTDFSDSVVVSQLYQADALLPSDQADPNALGLLASLNGTDSVLLLQPTAPLSPEALTAAAAAYAQAIPEFASVETDQMLELESPIFDWDQPDAEPAMEVETPVELSSDSTGPIRVAVIDSGVDKSHEIFEGVNMGMGWNTLEEDDTIYDDVGHGTHIAGIIATHAPGVEIVPYKIVGASGGKLSNVLEAFTKAIEDNVDVINTSFGVSSPSYALQTIVKKAYDKDIIVVSAAGNSGADTGFYPGHYAQTIAVASVDLGGHQLPSSNYGAWVDVAASGYHVRSALPHNEYGYKTGTSQATAFVSAAVARLLSANPDLTFKEVLEALQNSPESVSEGTLAGTPIVE